MGIHIPPLFAESLVLKGDTERACIRLQRAFRRRYYRFDRVEFIERLRLEARLSTLGGRLMLVIVLMILVFFSLTIDTRSVDYVKIQTTIDRFLGLSSRFTKHDIYGMADVSAFLAALPVLAGQNAATPDIFQLTRAVAEIHPTDVSACQAAIAADLTTTSFAMCGQTTNNNETPFLAYVDEIDMKSHARTIWLYFAFYSPVQDIHTLVEVKFGIPGTVDWKFLQQLPSASAEVQTTAILGIVLAAVLICIDMVRVHGWLHDHLSNRRTEGAKLKALGGVTGSKRSLSIWLFANLTSLILIIVVSARMLSMGVDNSNFVFAAADSVGTTFAKLTGMKKEFESDLYTRSLGVAVLYILLILVVNCLAGHPRVGVLTDTWYSAKDELMHFIISFLLIFVSQAAIGYAIFSSHALPFRTITDTLNFQYELLWSGQWGDRLTDQQLESYPLQWYLIIFVLLVQLILLNFFTAILIESYMAIRNIIASTRFSQSFLADAYDSLAAKILIKLGRLPRRQDVVSDFLKMFATRTLTIDNLAEQVDLFPNASVHDAKFMRFLRFYRKYDFLSPSQVQDAESQKEAAMWQQVSALLDILKNNQRRVIEQVASSNEDLQARLSSVEDRLNMLLDNSSSTS